jgi:hypothetical protein
MNWGRNANFHIGEINSSLNTYMNYTVQATGTIKAVELYVVSPPTATTTIGFKKSFLGNVTCFIKPKLSEWPTNDFVTFEFATSSLDSDCTYNTGETAIFTSQTPAPTAPSSPKIGGYTDPFFGTQVIPYFKVSTNEPFIVQDNGEVSFLLGFVVFFWALLFFGMIFNKIRA